MRCARGDATIAETRQTSAFRRLTSLYRFGERYDAGQGVQKVVVRFLLQSHERRRRYKQTAFLVAKGFDPGFAVLHPPRTFDAVNAPRQIVPTPRCPSRTLLVF